MHVIYISDQYPVGNYNRNGMYVYRTAKELSSKYEVTVLALHPIVPPLIPMIKNLKNSRSIYNEWRKKFPKNPIPPNDLDDVKVIYLKFFRLPRPKFLYTEAWSAYFKGKSILKNIIKDKTILHANWIFPEGHLARLLSKDLNIPYLITLRGSEFIYLDKKNLNGKFAQNIFNDAKKITAVANKLREQGLEKGINIDANKFSVLNDFYDFRIFEIRNKNIEKEKLLISNNTKNILFPGALRKIKNIYLVLKSIIVLKKKKKNRIHLYLAGYGYEENNLKHFVKNNQLTENVTFLGNLTAEELVSYYNACDLICLPSFSEGFPTVIVESLLCGTPVVASPVGGVPEVIENGKNGFLIDPHSVDSLTDGIEKCISKQWDRNNLRASVAYLSKENLMKTYSKLYKEVLEN